MNNFKDLFIKHFTKYPKMLPNDFFKLIYQNSHGPHHLDSNKLTTNFINELNSVTKPPKYQFEDIGNNYTRVYLNPYWTKQQRDLVLDAFIKSNLDYQPNIKLFYQEIDLLKEMVDSNTISIEKQLFTNELNSYLLNGIKPISHSMLYKQEYDPHYVLINNIYLMQIKTFLF